MRTLPQELLSLTLDCLDDASLYRMRQINRDSIDLILTQRFRRSRLNTTKIRLTLVTNAHTPAYFERCEEDSSDEEDKAPWTRRCACRVINPQHRLRFVAKTTDGFVLDISGDDAMVSPPSSPVQRGPFASVVQCAACCDQGLSPSCRVLVDCTLDGEYIQLYSGHISAHRTRRDASKCWMDRKTDGARMDLMGPVMLVTVPWDFVRNVPKQSAQAPSVVHVYDHCLSSSDDNDSEDEFMRRASDSLRDYRLKRYGL